MALRAPLPGTAQQQQQGLHRKPHHAQACQYAQQVLMASTFAATLWAHWRHPHPLRPVDPEEHLVECPPLAGAMPQQPYHLKRLQQQHPRLLTWRDLVHPIVFFLSRTCLELQRRRQSCRQRMCHRECPASYANLAWKQQDCPRVALLGWQAPQQDPVFPPIQLCHAHPRAQPTSPPKAVKSVVAIHQPTLLPRRQDTRRDRPASRRQRGQPQRAAPDARS
mmetsp:Transcript_28759/g.66321  ORF Transcript_28759/g.66321 Transcript_28759/m.66321 type:complete len:221 (-) Transcript_28759:387-1049(-)